MRRREFIAGLGSATAWLRGAWGTSPDFSDGAPGRIEAEINARPCGRIDGDPHARPRRGAWPDGFKRQLDLLYAGVAADLVRATAQEIGGAFDDLGRRDRRNAELVQRGECIDGGADEAGARCPTHLVGIAARLLQVGAINHHLG